MATKNLKFSDEEFTKLNLDNQKKLQTGAKDFFLGMAKGLTTDLPGFLMDVADKLAGDTKTLGENDRSAQLFEMMTGIKTVSGSGGADELVGGLVNPVNAVKAIIVPAALGKSLKAIALEKAGASIDQIYESTGIYRDPITKSLKEVIPDTKTSFKEGALKPLEHGYSSISESNNPSRVTSLANDIFTEKTLKDVLDHPALLDTNIMEVGETKVAPLIVGNALGSYNPDKDIIRLAGNKDPRELLSTLLHETQHSIQNRSGFVPGGNPEMFFDYPETFSSAVKNGRNLVNSMETEFNAAFKNSPGLEGYNYPASMLEAWQRDLKSPTYLAEHARKSIAALPVKTLKAYNQLVEAKQSTKTLRRAENQAFENYKKLGGEAEARLVQLQHKTGDYTTHPLRLMADELGVSLDELPSTLITTPTKDTLVDQSPEVKDALDFIKQLIESRSASQSTPPKK